MVQGTHQSRKNFSVFRCWALLWESSCKSETTSLTGIWRLWTTFLVKDQPLAELVEWSRKGADPIPFYPDFYEFLMIGKIPFMKVKKLLHQQSLNQSCCVQKIWYSHLMKSHDLGCMNLKLMRLLVSQWRKSKVVLALFPIAPKNSCPLTYEGCECFLGRMWPKTCPRPLIQP